VAEAGHATTLLATETSTQQSTAAWDSDSLRIKDAEDRAALAMRDALERVSRVEAENSAVLTSVREDAKGLARKIALLEDELTREHRARETSEREHQSCIKELTLL
jgi:hypothetical protein